MPIKMPLHLLALNLIGSALIGWFYLGWFYYYAQGNIYSTYCVSIATFCALLSFLWTIDSDEENKLTFCHFETGISLIPGVYVLANIAPMLREIRLQAGFAIWKKQRTDSTDIKIYKDQGRKEYSARVVTNSFFRLNADKFLSDLWFFLFDFKGGHAHIQYYKVGRTIFLFTYLATTACNHFYPSHRSPVTPAYSMIKPPVYSPPKSEESSKAAVVINVGCAVEPLMPTTDMFVPKSGNTEYHKIVQGKKYVLFTEPAFGEIRGVTVKDSQCLIIPAGRELKIMSSLPPTCAVNMERKVAYVLKVESVTFWDKLLSFQFGNKESLTIHADDSWKNVRDNWYKVDGATFGVDVKALPQSQISPITRGGLVCF